MSVSRTKKRSGSRLLSAAVLVTAVVRLTALPALAQPGDVEVADNTFTPAEITRDSGATVTWVWIGSNPHNVTSSDGRFPSSGPTQGKGSRHSARFTEPGTYSYLCTIHPATMRGAVVIRQQPPPPGPSPTRASPRSAPAPTRTTARPTATASPSGPGSASARPATSSRAPSPTEDAAPAAMVVQSSAPTAFTSSVTVPSPSSEPLATLDEPLPKDRSGLAVGLVLLVATVGVGTASTLLRRRRRTRLN